MSAHYGLSTHHTNTTNQMRDQWESYTCGHCSNQVTGLVVAQASNKYGGQSLWLRCPNCQEGSVKVAHGAVLPGLPFGPSVEGLPADIQDAYEEARQCMAVQAFTAAELICRKILMHVAVEKGAKAGESFTAYLTHLE
jgi:hypothetical protein